MQATIVILGHASLKDKKRGEFFHYGIEPGYQDLKDAINFIIKANPPFSNLMLATGKATIKKIMIPLMVYLWIELC